MGKPIPEDSSAAASSPQPAASGTVIRAEGGKWPDPPAGGCWRREANGDLHLVEAVGQQVTPEQRQKRREEQRAAALAAAAKNETKE